MELEKIAIPLVGNLKSDDLPDPETYTYWKDRKNRTFYIDYEIDDTYALMELAKVIIQMNVEEKDTEIQNLEPIRLSFTHTGETSNKRTSSVI